MLRRDRSQTSGLRPKAVGSALPGWWPEDEEPSPSRLLYGKRSRLFAGLTICGTHLSPSAKLVAEAALTA